MNNCEGVVEVVTQNKAGFWSVKIGDDWYGTGMKQKPPFDKGDVIKFQWEANGNWKNADNKSFVVVGKQENNAPQVGKEIVDNRQRSIVYQHSQEMAVRMLDVLISNDAIVLPAKKGDRYDALQEYYNTLCFDFYVKAFNPPAPEMEVEIENNNINVEDEI